MFSVRKGVPRDFPKFAGKCLCQSPFFNKVACLPRTSACNFIIKETLVQVFSCKFCKISKNTCFAEHFLQMTASILWWSLFPFWIAHEKTHFSDGWYFTLNFFIGRNTQQYWQSLACYNNFLLYNKQKILVQFPKNCFDCKKHPVTKISTMFLIKAVEQLVVDHFGKWSIQLPLPLSPLQ